MKLKHIITSSVIALSLAATSAYAELKVKITPDMGSVTVKHNGEMVTIKRNQDNNNTVDPKFAKTSRNCPPFCVQPMNLAPGVETYGEVEILKALEKMAKGDDSIIVVDSRTPDWVKRGSIPGSVNIPWTILKNGDPISVAEVMTRMFNARETGNTFDYADAKTVVLFCNGMWCGQSPNNIRAMLKHGYPASKIKWFRGGMQTWEILGFSTVKDVETFEP